MKLINTILLLAFLFVPMIGAFSATEKDMYITIGLPAKPLPGQESEQYGESEQDSSGGSKEHNSEGRSGSDDPRSKDSERFEDWYEPDPSYQ